MKSEPSGAAPFRSAMMTLEPGWIDYNGHLNMAYYNVLFDRCADEAFLEFGVSGDYVRERGLSVFTAEIHVRYRREIHLSDRVYCTFQILEHDEKRMRVWKEIRHEDGWISATCEVLYLHVDMSGPRAAPFPPDVVRRVAHMAQLHATLPFPDDAGRSIQLNRRD